MDATFVWTVVGSLAGVVAVVVMLLQWVLPAIARRRAAKAPGGTARPPATELSGYLNAFLSIKRCPEWDPNLCDARRIELAKIHYTVANNSDPPAFTGTVDSLTALPAATRTETVPRVVQRLLGGSVSKRGIRERVRALVRRRSDERGARRNVFVLLGDPGSGKSTFAIQAVQHVADQANHQADGWIPVYVNLAHFDAAYDAGDTGLERFITDALARACPRHLLRRTGTTAPTLLQTARRLATGGDGIKTFFVLDSMDEMPADKDLPARVEAIAQLIDDRHEATFLVTCRYRDFVKLASHAQNFQIQRLDLLPWTAGMVTDHIRGLMPGSKAEQDAVLARVLRPEDGPARTYFHPLEVLVLAKGSPTDGVAMSSLMGRFIDGRLRAHVPEARLGEVMDGLARVAFRQVWPHVRLHGQTAVSNLEEITRLGCAAGLLHDTTDVTSGPVFEIRPLLHHLAARELLRHIRTARGVALPARISLEDFNTLEVFRSLGEQAGSDQRWLRVLRKRLGSPATRRVMGDRLVFAAHAITETQLERDEDLRIRLEHLVEVLVVVGDDVERERALDALERRPALLDPKLPNVPFFFARIIADGSESALSWLLRLLARDSQLRRRFRGHWRTAFVRALDDGLLGKLLLPLIARRLPRWPVVGPVLHGVRYLLLFIGHYLTYVAAWTVAILALIPLYRTIPGFEADFAMFWRSQFTLDPRYYLSRLYFMIFMFYVPRHYLLQRAREGIGLTRWWRRYLLLAGITAGLRFLYGAVEVGRALLTSIDQIFRFLLGGLRAITIVVLLAVLVGGALTIAITVARRPRDWPRALRQLVRGWTTMRRSDQEIAVPVVSGSSGGAEGPITVPVLLPSVEMAVMLDLHRSMTVPGRKSLFERVGGWGLLAIWAVAVLVGLLRGGIAVGAGLVLLGLLLAVVQAFLVEPVNHCREVKRKIRQQVREELTEDLRVTFRGILGELAFASHPDWVRAAYVATLAEVRFDAELLKELEWFWATYYENAEASRTKKRLSRVILNARHEVGRAGLLTV